MHPPSRHTPQRPPPQRPTHRPPSAQAHPDWWPQQQQQPAHPLQLVPSSSNSQLPVQNFHQDSYLPGPTQYDNDPTESDPFDERQSYRHAPASEPEPSYNEAYQTIGSARYVGHFAPPSDPPPPWGQSTPQTTPMPAPQHAPPHLSRVSHTARGATPIIANGSTQPGPRQKANHGEPSRNGKNSSTSEKIVEMLHGLHGRLDSMERQQLADRNVTDSQQRVDREKVHDMQEHLKTFPTREDIKEDMRELLSPALHQFFAAQKEAIAAEFAALRQAMPALVTDQVKLLLLEQDDRVKREAAAQRESVTPLVGLMNHLIDSLRPLGALSAAAPALAQLPEAIQTVAVFQSGVDSLIKKVDGQSPKAGREAGDETSDHLKASMDELLLLHGALATELRSFITDQPRLLQNRPTTAVQACIATQTFEIKNLVTQLCYSEQSRVNQANNAVYYQGAHLQPHPNVPQQLVATGSRAVSPLSWSNFGPPVDFNARFAGGAAPAQTSAGSLVPLPAEHAAPVASVSSAPLQATTVAEGPTPVTTATLTPPSSGPTAVEQAGGATALPTGDMSTPSLGDAAQRLPPQTAVSAGSSAADVFGPVRHTERVDLDSRTDGKSLKHTPFDPVEPTVAEPSKRQKTAPQLIDLTASDSASADSASDATAGGSGWLGTSSGSVPASGSLPRAGRAPQHPTQQRKPGAIPRTPQLAFAKARQNALPPRTRSQSTLGAAPTTPRQPSFVASSPALRHSSCTPLRLTATQQGQPPADGQPWTTPAAAARSGAAGDARVPPGTPTSLARPKSARDVAKERKFAELMDMMGSQEDDDDNEPDAL